MMKRMGIQQQPLDCKQVIFVLEGKKLIINDPSVVIVNMMGQKTYQVTGEAVEELEETTPEISQEDIELVMNQTNCSEEEAKKAILESKGDLAQAILKLKKEE
ncbi:MAG: nascent polypeptide-associated complex subunit alpha [Candidatus Woesearchaeota archaeon]|nr:nascent polypeptide-associated complex subunit alpha [Candidatus Woesearchaeota archaeon]MDN5327424.1 nascent polypeptide-associated complex subunit alpha [Candidatus Woesearchaeota archaeon]